MMGDLMENIEKQYLVELQNAQEAKDKSRSIKLEKSIV